MDSNKQTILIAEDDKHIRGLVAAALKNSFQVLEASDGNQAIELAREYKPIIAILDIQLDNGTDGKEVCRSLKEIEPPSQPCGIIFMSASTDEETILECYEIGADDFVAKPFSIQSLRKKIEALVRHQLTVWQLKSNEDELHELVDTTMGQASNYGSALNAVKAMNYISDESALAKLIFEYFNNKNIFTAINFKHPSNPCFFDSSHEQCSPIEKEVFSLTANKGRLFSFSHRLVVNDQHVSILVKNAPPLEDDSYGIFIDIIAVLIEALEARYVAIINERRIMDAQLSVSTLVSDVKVTISGIQQSKQELVDKIVTQLGLSFHHLDMSEEQEIFFSELIEKTVLAHDQGNMEFLELMNKLEDAAKQLVVEEHSKIDNATQPSASATDDVTDSADIELF